MVFNRSRNNSRLLPAHRVLTHCALAVLGLQLNVQLVLAQDEFAQTPKKSSEPQLAEVLEGTKKSTPADHKVAWLTDRSRAQEIALRRNAPVIVIAGAAWCGPCQELKSELKKPTAQAELQRWVPLYLDIDTQPDDADQLAVSSIPALRVLSPGGRLTASREGLLSAEELSGWLQSQYDETMEQSVATDWDPGELTARQVIKILKAFRSREAQVREAATSRLRSTPEIAAAPVVAKFVDAGLAERLSYLDLLSAWDAPVDGLDPWIPSSITDERLKALQDWVEARKFPEQSHPDALDAVTTIEAERIIRRLKTATGTAAFSLREQLARIGPAVLPLLREARDEDSREDVQAAFRLARYRIVASDHYLTRFPGDLDLLVSNDFDQKVAAVDRLVSEATESEEQLLLELFTDPLPLIRELALKGLTKAQGSSAGGALVQLLDDEDPNVRAAVLQQLAENPSNRLVPRIVKYVEKENDPDLVVQAVRLFKAVETEAGMIAMSNLLDHASWRVRAEAADSLSSLIGSYKHEAMRTNSVLGKKLSKLLQDEDPFVARLAVNGLVEMELPFAKKDLIAAVDSQPEIAATIITALDYHWTEIDDGLDKLRSLVEHHPTDIRVAAAALLTDYAKDEDGTLIAKLLKDPERDVRLAVSRQIFQRIGSRYSSVLDSPEPNYGDGRFSYPIATVEEEPSVLGSIWSTLTGGKRDEGTVELTIAVPESTTIEAQNVDDEEASDGADPALEETAIASNDDGAADDSSESTEKSSDSKSSPTGWQQELQKFVTQHNVDAKIKELSGELLQDPVLAHSHESLLNLFQSEDAVEKLTAAISLVGLGDEKAWKYVLETADQRQSLPARCSIMQMITWKQKQELFPRIWQTADSVSEYELVAHSTASTFDQRTSSLLWDVAGSEETDDELLGLLADPLWRSHCSRDVYDPNSIPKDTLKYMKERAAKYVQDGSPGQQVLSLVLLTIGDAAPALEAAKKLLDDKTSPSQLRLDAIQISLASSPEGEANALAVEILKQGDPSECRLALIRLSMGNDEISSLRESIALESASGFSWSTTDNPQIIRPTAPTGLTIEHLQPFLTSDDELTVQCARYQAVLLGKTQHLDSLVQTYLKNYDFSDQAMASLVYRAIASADESSKIDVLEQLYSGWSKLGNGPTLSEFYWTIRAMTGPEIIKFRGRIRSEQGADGLKWVRSRRNDTDNRGMLGF